MPRRLEIVNAMNRIEAKFAELRRAGQKAFIPFITAGDPDLETTLRLVIELERSGADVIELGVPFSDPMADGPVIQRASERALERGVSARDCIDLVRRVREQSEMPILLIQLFQSASRARIRKVAGQSSRRRSGRSIGYRPSAGRSRSFHREHASSGDRHCFLGRTYEHG